MQILLLFVFVLSVLLINEVLPGTSATFSTDGSSLSSTLGIVGQGRWGPTFDLHRCSKDKCCPSRFECCVGQHSYDYTYYCCEAGTRKIFAVTC